ncbi:MAG: DUF1499 domain-containing protein [Pseudomonadota bacterium]
MDTKIPWHARIAFVLALILPVYLGGSALGTKFGLWDWQLGLSAFAIGGMVLIAITVLLALVSLILILRKAPRKGWSRSAIALLIPLGFIGFFAPIFLEAGNHPIHDVATDPVDPPQFSEQTLELRAGLDANPVYDYVTPLSQLEYWSGGDSPIEPPMANQTLGDIIAERYPDLAPLPSDGASTNEVVLAIEQAMADAGISEIRSDSEAGTVEGVAETFWFGFKDDVAVRVADGEIDFRSISRVGRSDVGANAARIRNLREAVAARLTE